MKVKGSTEEKVTIMPKIGDEGVIENG